MFFQDGREVAYRLPRSRCGARLGGPGEAKNYHTLAEQKFVVNEREEMDGGLGQAGVALAVASRGIAEIGNHGRGEVDPQGVWAEVTRALGRMVGEDALQRWFRAARLAELNDAELVVRVPNEIHRVWIETNYLPELAAAVAETLDGVRRVVLMVGEGEVDEVAPVREPFAGRSSSQQVAHGDKKLKAVGLNPMHSFERFVVGTNSQFAHAACQAVAKKSGVSYNPLFIHGNSGLGKTHLMQAIGQQLLAENPEARVVYLTCEKFTNEFIDAIRKGDIERFRKRYRSVDVMLIDDVQFLVGKERSQEEFFHTFNTLLDGRHQVVLTSDRPACEIKNLEPRLVSRFECGLTVELQPPAVETRIAILRRKMDEWHVTIDDAIIRYLAERIRSNVRRLEGALMRVATFASLAGESLTIERVEHLLRDILREEATRQVTVDAIQRVVAEHFDVRLADMTSRRRPANIAFPRQVAMYLSRSMTKGSLVEIGEAFGGRDHGTVIHACRKVAQRIQSEAGLKEVVGMLESSLRR
jgi:chromosomal replication initiator protein